MIRAKVRPDLLKQWGEQVIRRLEPAMLEIFDDGSIEYDAGHPAWIAERFRRKHPSGKVTK